MRRAILHPGWPRTGTTTFQRILTQLRPALAERGIAYPDLTPASAAEPHLSHQHLGETLDGRRPVRERGELMDRLDALLAERGPEVVLISYEGLSQMRRPERAAAALAGLMGRHGYAVEILATIKPQGEFLNSSYTWRSQFLREKRVFKDFALAQLNDRKLDHAALLAPWRAVATGPVHVVPVRDATSSEPLPWRLFAALGLLDQVKPLLTATDLTLTENRSPGPVAVEVSRRLRAEGAHRQLGARVREATRQIERSAVTLGFDLVPFKGMDDALRDQIAGRFAERNDRFARQAWGVGWAERVAEEPRRARNEIAGGAEHREAVEAIMAEIRTGFGLRPGLLGRLRARLAA
jgi:hypothetical protein